MIKRLLCFIFGLPPRFFRRLKKKSDSLKCFTMRFLMRGLMNAKALLLKLKSAVEADFELSQDLTMAIDGDRSKAEAIVTVPVEGKVRILRLLAVPLPSG